MLVKIVDVVGLFYFWLLAASTSERVLFPIFVRILRCVYKYSGKAIIRICCFYFPEHENKYKRRDNKIRDLPEYIHLKWYSFFIFLFLKHFLIIHYVITI